MPDVLVVGGGIAGLRAAVAARRRGAQVALVTKAHPLRSYSITHQDGINAAVGPGDSWEEHAADTLRAGEYLADQDVVEAFCQEAPQAVQELDAMGAPFNRGGNGTFALARLAGSERPRASYIHDMTGHALAQVLYEQALKEAVQFFEEWYVVSLVMEGNGCCGAIAVELASGKMELLPARAVVLATGGARRLYEPSTASTLCTADGIGLAYRAGVSLVDMEMVQYHPCVLKKGRLALSELLLAQGAQVVNGAGEPLRAPDGQPPGHTLARAAAQELAAGRGKDGYLFLKAGITPQAAATTFYATGARVKMFLRADLAKDPIPVAPAMHRLLGGVAADAHGATSVSGLFTAGECAGNGFHGAGALDGNGLLASVLSGRRAGEAAAEAAAKGAKGEPSRAALADQEKARSSLLERETSVSLASLRQELAGLMHLRAGLERDEPGLQEAARRIQALRANYEKAGLKNKALDFNFELLHYHEVGAMLDAAESIVASALARRESRGVHQRIDFPRRDDAVWSKHLLVERGDSGPRLRERPVRVTRWPAGATVQSQRGRS
jgi:succinate dehydrogenase / fumarate reductase flavoprotein subunit